MFPALGDAGKVAVIAPEPVSTKNPAPFVASKLAVFLVVFQLTVPVLPNPACVPLFVIVTPAGIANESPLSPNVTVPQFVLVQFYLLFTSLIINYLDIDILLLPHQNHHFHQNFVLQRHRHHRRLY